MKHTGIIRRMDDLGRVVIPKEVRKPLCLREGDAFELVIIDDSIVGFVPYQKTVEISALCDRIEEEIEFSNFSSSNAQELHKCINQLRFALRVAESSKKEKEGI